MKENRVGLVTGVITLMSLLLLSSCRGSINTTLADQLAKSTPGAPTQLVFTATPRSAAAMSALSPAVTVAVKDVNGNTITTYTDPITLTLADNPGSAILSGTISVKPVLGIATFSNLTLDKVGQGYTLKATSGSLTPAVSSSFYVSAGALNGFLLIGPSSLQVVTGSATAVTVAPQDAGGNLLPNFTGTVSLSSTDPLAVLPACIFAALDHGLKSCSFTLNTQGTQTVTFTYGTASTTTSSMTVTPITAATIASISVSAGDSQSAVVGTTLPTALRAVVRDSGSNPIAGVPVTFTVTAGGGSLSNVSSTTDSTGSVTATLTLGLVAGVNTVTASTAGLSATFTETATAGAASKLAFTTEPSAASAGISLNPAPVVTVQDANGNTVSSYSSSITLSIGTNAGGATLGGTVTISPVAGVATFSNINLSAAGVGYTLTVSSGGLTSATSGLFSVSGTAFQLAFVSSPGGRGYASQTAFSPSIQVAVQDANGITVGSSSASITLALGTNTVGGTLAGTLTRAAVNGVATFNDLTLDQAATNYTMTASSAGLSTITSAAFTIMVASPSQVAFTTGLADTLQNVCAGPFQLNLKDAGGNVVSNGSTPVAFNISSSSTHTSFYLDSACSSLPIPPAQVGFASWASTSSEFYLKNTVAESITVTADGSAAGLGTKTYPVIVGADPTIAVQVGGEVGAYATSSNLAVDRSGNTYVVGRYDSGSAGIVGAQIGTHGTNDYFIAKYSSAGTQQWANQVGGGGGGVSAAEGIAVDRFGNSYVVGRHYSGSSGSIGTQVGDHGNGDYFITKYNSSGTQQWSYQVGAGGATASGADDVVVDSVGNIYVTGVTTGVLGTQIGTHGSRDYFIAKYNSSGVQQWSYQVGGGGSTFAEGGGIAIDSFGNSYVTGGVRQGDVGTQIGTHGTSDYFIAKFNSSGVQQWSYQVGGGGYAYGYDIAVDLSGNFYVTGEYDGGPGEIGTQVGGHGGSDYFIARYNSSGVQQWSYQVGGGGYAYGNDIAVDLSGNFYVTGEYDGGPGEIGAQVGDHGSGDYFIAKYNSSGVQQWAYQGGGGFGTYAFGLGISVDSAGNSYITGGYASGYAGTIGAQIDTHGNTDYFIKSFTYRTGIPAQLAFAEGTDGLTNACAGPYRLKLQDISGYPAFNSTGVTAFIGVSSTSSHTSFYLDSSCSTQALSTAQVSVGSGAWESAEFYLKNTVVESITLTADGSALGAGSKTYPVAITTTPTIAVQVGGGSSKHAYSNGIAVDSSGNSYVTGEYDGGFGGIGSQVGAHGYKDYIIGKYSPFGTQLWSYQVGGGGGSFSYGNSIAVDSSGNAYVAGRYDGASGGIGTQIGTHGSTDYFIAKHDSAGRRLWSYQVGGAGTVLATSITVDSSGNSYVTGINQGGAAGGLGTQIGTHGSTDYLIAKYNSAGTQQWSYQVGAGASTTAWANDITVDSSGNIYVMGELDAGDEGALGTQIGSHSFADYFVTKFDSSGTQLWSNQVGGGMGSYTSGSGIAVDSSGNVYVVGQYRSGTAGALGTQVGTHGADDYFIAKYSSTGTQLWSDQVGGAGSSSSWANRVAIDSFGNIYVTGGYDSGTVGGLGTQTGTHGTGDYFIAKYSSAGSQIWTEQVGGGASASSWGMGVALDFLGNAYVTGGYDRGTAGALGTQIGTHGSTDFFIKAFPN